MYRGRHSLPRLDTFQKAITFSDAGIVRVSMERIIDYYLADQLPLSDNIFKDFAGGCVYKGHQQRTGSCPASVYQKEWRRPTGDPGPSGSR